MAESRYYVSSVTNAGAGNVPTVATITDPLAGDSLAFKSVYRQSANLSWALVVCYGNRHSLARNVSGIIPFPVLTFDATLANADATERTAFLAALGALGIDLSTVTLSTSIRGLVQLLGDAVDVAEGSSGFDADTFIVEV